jgi:hypothetical protein
MNEQIARKLKLSENFTLWEFLRSQKAEELGLIGDQFDIGESEINHLRLLCVNVLEPLRKRFGVIFISSGYRSPKLNTATKGSKTSDHMAGKAADIKFIGMAAGYNWIKMNCEYKQAINEYDFQWIHVSYDPNNNKKQTLKLP